MSGLLGRLRLRPKLYGVAVMAAVAVVLVLAEAAVTMHGRMFQDRLATLQVALDATKGELDGLNAKVTAGKLSKDEALNQFRAFVDSYRFAGGSGYVVSFRSDGIVVENGVDSSQSGTFVRVLDTSGAVISEMIMHAVASADSGIATYHYKKPGGTEILPKTVLVQRYKPWDMVLATGTYTDDIEADFMSTMTTLAVAADWSCSRCWRCCGRSAAT